MFVSSCVSNHKNNERYLPYFQSLISDTTSQEFQSLRTYSEEIAKNPIVQRNGSIAIIGDLEYCYDLTKSLLSADYFDNINAEEKSDGLHDFAGECITPLFNYANDAYKIKNLYENKNVSSLIDYAVTSIDTLVYKNPYTAKKEGRKSFAKCVILACLENESVIKSELDTISTYFGLNLKVISPSTETKKFFKRYPNVAVFSDNASVYNLENQILKDSSYSSIAELLEKYDSVVSVIFVDKRSKYKELVEELKIIRESEGVTYEKYKKLLPDSLKIVTLPEILTKSSYLYLRESKLSSFKASFPLIDAYITIPEQVYKEVFKTRIIKYDQKWLNKEYSHRIDSLVAPIIVRGYEYI